MLILFIILTVLSFIWYRAAYKKELEERKKHKDEYFYDSAGWYVLAAIVAATCGLFVVGTIIGIFVGLHNEQTIDDEITLLEQNIADSEAEVSSVVHYYIVSEHSTLADIAPGEDATAVALAIPELGSSELVSKQIDNIQNNRNTLLEKKQSRLQHRMWRFWLYFGRP